MHGDTALTAQCVFVPNALVDLAGREHAVGIAHEQVQDVVLYGRQIHRLAVHGHGLLSVVELDAADTEHVLDRLWLELSAETHIAPQVAAHARLHFHGVEGLCHIVVGPDIQAQHLIGEFAFGREEYYGDIELLTKLYRCGYAVHLRHHDVHEHEVYAVLTYAVQRLAAGRGGVQRVVLVCEIDFERRNDIRIVVAYEYPCHILHLVNIIRCGPFKKKEAGSLNFV